MASFYTMYDFAKKIGKDKIEVTVPYKASIPIRTEGSARTFRIVHIMTDNPLTGISDIGIRLRKPENQ